MPRIPWTPEQRQAEIDGLASTLGTTERSLLTANRIAADLSATVEHREQARISAGWYGEQVVEYTRLLDGLRSGKDPGDLGYPR
ncbi:hypothetical protein [Embleya sp. NPDC059259]|uniref:hypothetical protein n=1 Tax=unclassified Embleya TaxID=2699296 RepID=UPI00367A30D3